MSVNITSNPHIFSEMPTNNEFSTPKVHTEN